MDNITKLILKFNDSRFYNSFDVNVIQEGDRYHIISESFNLDFINDFYIDKSTFIKEINNFNIKNWGKTYNPPNDIVVLDGFSWSLNIYSNESNKRYKGNNAYPKEFIYLLGLLRVNTKKLDLITY